jgi:Predicted soluble lytic transglycosylase fused to an ABC-type amino acid-binding protein
MISSGRNCIALILIALVHFDANAQPIATANTPAVAQDVSQANAQSTAVASKKRQLGLTERPWTGDFDAMIERRMIRVVVPHSRTLYYNDKGREGGITAELVRDFERYINKKYAKQLGGRPITVYIYPTTRDKLLPQLTAGGGDIAAGNLTVTKERLKTVDFVAMGGDEPIREIVVTGPSAPHIKSVEELSGAIVHVRPASSYHESLVALNGRFKSAGKAPVKIALLPDAIEDEDKLEMLNAGLFEYVVVDDWKAKIWAQVLPKVKVREDLVLRDEARIGWATRKNSPQLSAALQDFHKNFVKKQGVVAYRFARFKKRIKQISNNTGTAEWKRFENALALFEKYGAKYGFDPLMLAAQGYQESKLDQSARSRAGAVGVMQIMPATGKELKVGDIKVLEHNIHAGAKYLDQLTTRYFPDAAFSEAERPLFAFASYNAGPGNISRIRKEAAKRGLDPDKWFNNVELLAAEKIGIETTTYVRNIYKYYVAYKLQQDVLATQRNAREQMQPVKN